DHVGNPCSSYPRISSGLRPVSASAAYRPPIFINCAAMRSGRRRRRSRARRSRKARVTAEVKLSPVRSASSLASLWASSFLILRCIAFFIVEFYIVSTIGARRRWRRAEGGRHRVEGSALSPDPHEGRSLVQRHRSLYLGPSAHNSRHENQ